MTTVAFTRPADRIADSVKAAEDMGLVAIAAPSLEVMDGHQEDYDDAERLLSSRKVDYTIFGSGTAVDKCVERFGRDGFIRLFTGSIIVAIGPNTAAVLRRSGGIEPKIMPINDHSSYGLVNSLGKDVNGKTVMLVRSDSGSDVLLDGLKDNGANVVEFAAYRLKEVGMTDDLMRIMDGLEDGSIDVMAFTSPMSAESFIGLLDQRYGHSKAAMMMDKVKVAAIGRPTSLRLQSLGRVPDIIPEKTTFLDMLQAVKDYYWK